MPILVTLLAIGSFVLMHGVILADYYQLRTNGQVVLAQQREVVDRSDYCDRMGHPIHIPNPFQIDRLHAWYQVRSDITYFYAQDAYRPDCGGEARLLILHENPQVFCFGGTATIVYDQAFLMLLLATGLCGYARYWVKRSDVSL